MIFKKTRRKEIFPQNTTFQRSNLFFLPSFLLSFFLSLLAQLQRSILPLSSRNFHRQFERHKLRQAKTVELNFSANSETSFEVSFPIPRSTSTLGSFAWSGTTRFHPIWKMLFDHRIRTSSRTINTLSLSLFLSVAVTPLERRSMKKKENKRMVGKEEGTRMDGIRGIFLSSRNDHAAHWTLYLLGSLRGERQVSRARREVDHLRHRSLAPNHPDNSYRATHWQSLSAERTNFSSLFLTPFVNLDWSFSKHKFSRSILVIFGGIPQLLILHLHSEWIWVRRWVTLEIIFRRMRDLDNLCNNWK